jgi:two-component system, chemotaxis family, sensor kinase Cph1
VTGADRATGLSGMTRGELDALPYGAIKLDAGGRILSYNAAESLLTGRDPERVMGRNFFTEVAPCTQVREFYGRFAELVEHRSVNREFDFTFALEPPVEVRITMLYEQREGAVWVLVDRK